MQPLFGALPRLIPMVMYPVLEIQPGQVTCRVPPGYGQVIQPHWGLAPHIVKGRTHLRPVMRCLYGCPTGHEDKLPGTRTLNTLRVPGNAATLGPRPDQFCHLYFVTDELESLV